MTAQLRIGVDVGGTFTDVVILLPDGTAIPKKVLSSPPDFSVAIKAGIAAILVDNGFVGGDIQEYTHGATVATNCILTRTGAVTGLITTQGFRDVLEIRRMRMHKLYDITWEKPKPLVPRHLRLEVPARTDANTGAETTLDEESVRNAVWRLKAEGIQSIAVCYLHSYANGANERRTREIIREMAPEWTVSISSEVLPEIKEYERTSTTVINAYVQSAVSGYTRAMEADALELGVNVPIMIMQSNGGMMPIEIARERPVHIVESGPAAGVTGVYHLARRMGIKDAITLDMGGTTAKAAIIEDGEISRSPEYEVGGDISIGHRLMKGSGYLLRVQSIDLAEVGAGGGSVAWVDSAGALKVGPKSAGASPGPACYGRGGQSPTITDANVHLGLTNPHGLAGGSLKIYPDLAERSINDVLAQPLAIELTRAAWGVRIIANSSLIRALRAVSTERGRDPRLFTLFAFGGMGPVQALDVANELGIKKVIVPPLPGLFSSLGLLFAEVEHHLIRTHYASLLSTDLNGFNEAAAALVREGLATLEREGYDSAHQTISLFADTRYLGQDHALSVPFPETLSTPNTVDKLIESFHREHQKTFGYRSDGEEVQVVALRCLARGIPDHPKVPERLLAMTMHGWQPSGSRKAYFGPEYGWVETSVISRRDLSAGPAKGPVIIEEDNSLTVVPPNWTASLDDWFNIVLERI
jgi:N-methylhydantoinase A